MKTDPITNTIIVEDATMVLPKLIKAKQQYDVIDYCRSTIQHWQRLWGLY